MIPTCTSSDQRSVKPSALSPQSSTSPIYGRCYTKTPPPYVSEKGPLQSLSAPFSSAFFLKTLPPFNASYKSVSAPCHNRKRKIPPDQENDLQKKDVLLSAHERALSEQIASAEKVDFIGKIPSLTDFGTTRQTSRC